MEGKLKLVIALVVIIGLGKEEVIEEDMKHTLFSKRYSLVFDKQDVPHVVYGSKDQSTLYHAERENGQWKKEQLKELDMGSFIGGGIAVGSDGNLHVAYLARIINLTNVTEIERTEKVGYAKHKNDNWNFYSETEFPAQSGFDFYLDGNNHPHVAGIEFESSDDEGIRTSNLRYASWNGDKWETSVVDGENIPKNPEIVADKSGAPHLVYRVDKKSRDEYAELRHATFQGGSWKDKSIRTTDKILGQMSELKLHL